MPTLLRRPKHRSGAHSAARRIKGARPALYPGFITPCHPEDRDTVPDGPDWLYEIKHDGYRAQLHIIDRKVRIFTRRGYDWTERFAAIAAAARSLPSNHLVLDGEIAVPRSNGVADYQLLLSALAQGRSDRMIYYAFDLLHLDGLDLRGAPLDERKRVLEALLAGQPQPIVYGSHLDANGAVAFRRGCEMGLEGIIAKRRSSRYVSGRNDTWIKIKCSKSGTYPIVAFVEKLGASPRRIASLYIGQWRDGKLVYAGKVRSGYSEAVARAVREKLDPLIRTSSPLSHPIKKPKATWVEPKVDAEVAYSAITSDGLLRAAVFKGLREDLEEVMPPTRRPAPAPGPARRQQRNGRAHVSVPRENILQLLPEAVAPSKEALTAYWRKVAPRALAHLAHRPLKLVRHSHGTIFYHKGRLPPVADAVHKLTIEKREGGEGTRLWVDDLDGLLGLVAIGAVELHPWNARVDDIEHPDQLVFDLDPGDGVAWDVVIETALHLRERLKEEGLASWPKLTGGKGLHVVAPVEPRLTHDQAHRFARGIAQAIAARDPGRYTLAAAMAKRPGRLFIDYLRNGRGTTAVGAYSPRVRPGFPIAAPVTWTQVQSGIRPDAFSTRKLPRRSR